MMEAFEENPKHQCEICGKNFYSIKALFGHMRSHRDRSWRGIRPPLTPSPSAAEMSLPRWSVTAQRGRKPTAAASFSSSNSSPTSELTILKSAQTAAANSHLNRIERNMGELCTAALNVVGCQDHQENNLRIPTKKLHERNSCTKQFSTHQALGGLKSSHDKTLTALSNITGTTASLDSDLTTQTDRRRRILDFDLNELPPIEDEDNDGEATDHRKRHRKAKHS